MNSQNITVGAAAIGLAILGVNLWRWWKTSSRAPKDLAPFGGYFALGALSTVCGGILGVLNGWTVHLNNKGGNHAIPGTTGTDTSAITTGSAGHLTPGGGLAVFLLAVAAVVAWKAAGKTDKRRMLGGWWAGATLTWTSGVASLVATTLTPAANSVGDQVLSTLNGVISL